MNRLNDIVECMNCEWELRKRYSTRKGGAECTQGKIIKSSTLLGNVEEKIEYVLLL